jgi:cardiolipin synthase
VGSKPGLGTTTPEDAVPLLIAILAALGALIATRVIVRRRPASTRPLGPEDCQAYAERLGAMPTVGKREMAMAFAETTATNVEPLLHGTRYFPRMLDDIRAATSSISLLIYGWKPGEVGTLFRDALLAKMAEGVEVRVAVDGIGSEIRLAARDFYRELVETGLPIVSNEGLWADIDGPLGGRRVVDRRFDDLLHFDHRKMMVVDGRVAYVGGSGIEDHFNDERFYDVMARMEGPIVAQLQTVFLATWRFQGGPLPAEAGALGHLYPTETTAGEAGAPAMVLMNDPGYGYYPISEAIEAAIEAAGRRIDIVNPYIADRGIIDRLVDAAERGVAVRIICPGKPTPPQAAAAFRHHYPRLLAAGATILAHPEMAHAKVVRVDDVVMIGGCNLDALSLYKNWELNVEFRDPGVAEAVGRDIFDPFVAMSIPAVPTADRMRRLYDRAMDLISPLL